MVKKAKGQYTVPICKRGSEPELVSMVGYVGAWHPAGDLFFGGLIGWFIVEPASGAVWTLKAEDIDPALAEETVRRNQLSTNELHIVLLNDLPARLRDKLRRVK